MVGFLTSSPGIETVQVIQYAGRVLQLADHLFSGSFEPEFLERLELAKSNVPEHKDGRTIYEKFVRPAMLDLKNVGAHYAISSLFHENGERSSIYFLLCRHGGLPKFSGRRRKVCNRACKGNF